jgi:glutathione S-transferase
MTSIPTSPLRLYTFPLSGHAHRVQLFMSLLNLPFEMVSVDLRKGEQKSPEFLALNPLGQVPVLQDGALTLTDSNAMLVYLATKYADPSWLPRDPAGAAAVQRFLSIAAGEIARGPATARLIHVFKAPLDHALAMTVVNRILPVIEGGLTGQDFLVGAQPTIADVACYTYIAHAPEGGVSLAAYPYIRAWLARVAALPGFVPMQASPLPPAA